MFYLRRHDIQYNDTQHIGLDVYDTQHNWTLTITMLCITLSVIMLNVIMLNVITLNVIMLNVVFYLL